jgi:hypothetical protein
MSCAASTVIAAATTPPCVADLQAPYKLTAGLLDEPPRLREAPAGATQGHETQAHASFGPHTTFGLLAPAHVAPQRLPPQATVAFWQTLLLLLQDIPQMPLAQVTVAPAHAELALQITPQL